MIIDLKVIEELEQSEMRLINGGSELSESLCYWAGYLARKIVEGMPETSPNMGRL